MVSGVVSGVVGWDAWDDRGGRDKAGRDWIDHMRCCCLQVGHGDRNR